MATTARVLVLWGRSINAAELDFDDTSSAQKVIQSPQGHEIAADVAQLGRGPKSTAWSSH